MVTEIKGAGENKLSVVFERLKSDSFEVNHGNRTQLVKKAKFESQYLKKAVFNDILPKEKMKITADIIAAELDKARKLKSRRIPKVAMTLQKSGNLENNVKFESQYKKKVIFEIFSKETVKNSSNINSADLDMARKRKSTKMLNVAMAVQMANQRENLVTEKFVKDLESLNTLFKPELDKMKELFGNILKRLPQV